MDKITIERETLEQALDALEHNTRFVYDTKSATARITTPAIAALRAALAAQPAEPDMRHPKIQVLIGKNARQHIWMMLVEQLVEDPNFETTSMDMEYWDTLHDKLKEKLTAQPAPAAVPPDGMDTVAIKYAHKMALDLECILAEYGGSWYNTAMQTLGEYRSEMNAIHERECPTFMGEPVIAAAGDKP